MRTSRRTTILATISMLLSAALFVIAGLWWVEAERSSSSTAAIGIVFAMALVVIAAVPVVFASLALALRLRRPDGAHISAVIAISIHVFIAVFGAWLFLPGMLS